MAVRKSNASTARESGDDRRKQGYEPCFAPLAAREVSASHPLLVCSRRDSWETDALIVGVLAYPAA